MSHVEQRSTGQASGRSLTVGPSLMASLWRYRVPVVAATIVVAILVYWLSSLRPDVYEARATLVLQDASLASVFQPGNTGRVDPDRYVPQQANFATSRPVLQQVSDQTSVPLSQLNRQVTVEGDPELSQLSIIVSNGDPEQGAEIANAVADAYEALAEEQSIAQVQTANQIFEEQIASLREQIDELETRLANDPDDSVAQSRLRTLESQLLTLETRASEIAAGAIVFGSGVELRENALTPENPASPNPARDAVIAGVLAFGLATATAYWRAGSVKRVAHRVDPGEILGIPLLGEIPRFRKLARSPGGLMVSSEATEAYQFVLSSIDFSMAEINASSLLVTSAGAGDGKTSTALQLAMASARETRAVMLVDADVRARGLTSMLRAEDAPGIVQLANGHAELNDCVREYRLSDAATLSVVPAGQTPDDPVGLIRTAEFSDAVEQIKAKTDLAILDSPPLLPVADATVLAGRVDAIVLVVDADTHTEELMKIRERLTFVSTPLIGYVYNRAATDRSARQGYGYGYGSSSSEEASGWRRFLGDSSFLSRSGDSAGHRR